MTNSCGKKFHVGGSAMYEDTLRRHLDEIIDNLGVEDPDLIRKYKNFKLEISNRIYASKSGDYDRRTMKIRITKTSSHNNANEVSTTLHELAHHINFCNGGERGHGTDFYNVFRELIFSALDLKKITLQEMKNMNRSNADYSKVMKMLNEYENRPSCRRSEEKFEYEINVPGIAENDPQLIPYGYKYNQRRKTWYKNVDSALVEYEKEFLGMIGIDSLQLKDANTIQMLDDEAEYLNYQKSLTERRKTILERTEKEYGQLKEFIGKLIRNGYDYDGLRTILDGTADNESKEKTSFRFRYITLGGELESKDGNIVLSDIFDIYEYREKDCVLVMRGADIRQINQALAEMK